ncbi:MAG: hypothetical protein LQ339_006804 [Xanthoria mediterranea]|nr:MAG: hypothetical protein LQ339_006804 [Xanthoria mediterranea]
MVVTTIYVTRHAFRVSYTLNTATGEYHTNSPSPTNIPSDPPLAAYGVQQSHELALELAKLDPPVDYLYSSPFYRCLQTLEPAVQNLGPGIRVRADNGIGEWYGIASFHHPSPATPAFLKSLFPSSFDDTYQPSLIPPPAGETVAQLHDRVAVALAHIIGSVDAENTARETSILLCTHAATLIAIGRTLTGNMPDDPNVDDFLAPTAGITKFLRKQDSKLDVSKPSGHGTAKSIGIVDWRNGQGVAAGWTCVLNGNCDHLTGGAERSWRFSGEETLDDLASGQKLVSAEAGKILSLSGQVYRLARKSRI